MAISLRDRNRQAAMSDVRRIAFALMEANGFEAVTVEQIAAQSSVSPSTVYRYFGTKEALVLSADRVTRLAGRLERDGSSRDALAAFRKAAVKTWGSDDTAVTEIGLVAANPALTVAWERLFLDQRVPVASALADRRGATSVGTRDEALASAALSVLMTMLLRWQRDGGGKKPLDKLLAKAFAAVGG